MNNSGTRWSILAIATAFLCMPPAQGQEHKIVVGPNNFDLMDGASALLEGDAEKGVELTLAGLQHSWSRKERVTGLSNLCGGYIMLERFDDALTQCDAALAEDPDYWRARTNRALVYILVGRYGEAERDLSLVEERAPQARTVIAVRELLRDRVNPVEPIIIIDDRRDPGIDDDTIE